MIKTLLRSWKAPKIHSHLVAIAELCSKLNDLITWYKHSKHTSNVSKLAEATMTKGRSQKGACALQTRKPSVPLEQVLKTLVYFQMNLFAIPSIC